MGVDLVTVFLGVPALSKARIHCQRIAPFPQGKPRIIAPFQVTCTVLHPLTMPFCRRVVVLLPWCLHIRFARFWLVEVHFDQSVTCKWFQTFRDFQLLLGMLSRQGVVILTTELIYSPKLRTFELPEQNVIYWIWQYLFSWTPNPQTSTLTFWHIESQLNA